MKLYYVYILASTARVLYIGVTGDFENRLITHRWYSDPESFTARYNVNHLVYYEEYTEIDQAIAREKQLKSWNRRKKVELIEKINPQWKDLARGLPLREEARRTRG
jgi:putative endonuclease